MSFGKRRTFCLSLYVLLSWQEKFCYITGLCTALNFHGICYNSPMKPHINELVEERRNSSVFSLISKLWFFSYEHFWRIHEISQAISMLKLLPLPKLLVQEIPAISCSLSPINLWQFSADRRNIRDGWREEGPVTPWGIRDFGQH